MVLADLRWSESLALRNEHGNGTWICTHCGAGKGIKLAMMFTARDCRSVMRKGSIEGRHLQILLKPINHNRGPA
jgi:hypothetical protein